MKKLVFAIITLVFAMLVYSYNSIEQKLLIISKPSIQTVVAANKVPSRGSTERRSDIKVKAGFSEKAEKVQELDSAIQVMTYNIHRGINKKGKLDIDEIVEQIKLSGAELIGLQEVERYSIRTRFQDQIEMIAQSLSMNYAYGKSLNILNGHYGNAILSIYPIEEYEVLELPYDDERRTVLKALININGNKLYVFNTHLGLDEIERKKQMDSIKAVLGEQELDYILMGDFNTGWDKLSDIADLVKDSASIYESKPSSTFQSDDYCERIDYILVSKNLKVVDYEVVNSDASDHYPVISKIKLQ